MCLIQDFEADFPKSWIILKTFTKLLLLSEAMFMQICVKKNAGDEKKWTSNFLLKKIM